MNRKTKRARFEAFGGRAGISERIIEIAGQIRSVNSFKRAIVGAGQIRALAEISESDTYWDEKMSYGHQTELEILNGARKVVFDAYGMALDHLETNEKEPPK